MKRKNFTKITIMAAIMLSIISCRSQSTDTPPVGDAYTLEVNLVKQMTATYQEMNSPNNQNTTSIWFEYNTLKKFLEQVEQISKSTDGSIRSSDLGIRIYLSTYPDASNWGEFVDLESISNNIETWQNKNTVILIPTLYRNGVHRDFDPLREFTYNEGIPIGASKAGKIIIESLENMRFQGGASTSADDLPVNDRTMGLNHGTLIPPPGGNQITSF